jgi:hypothetical protein
MTNHWRCSKKFILVGFSLLKVNILEPDVYFINTKNHTKENISKQNKRERVYPFLEGKTKYAAALCDSGFEVLLTKPCRFGDRP